MTDKKNPVNTHRYDPYKSFRFRVKFDGKIVAGISKMHTGGEKSEPITLERGVTHDAGFENWARMTWNAGEEAARPLRKDIVIEVLNEKGEVIRTYKADRCRVSKYQAIPELDASAQATAIEQMVLHHEGLEVV
jgi:phage tail-like protein